MGLFVILSNTSIADIKGLKIESCSWTDKAGAKHEVGALRIGENLVRQTKDGRLLVEKAVKKVAKGVK